MASVIGDRIRAYREARGLNQTDMAAQLGITKSYLSHLEAGRRGLTPKLAEVLEIELDHGEKQMKAYEITLRPYNPDSIEDLMRTVVVAATSPENALRAAAELPVSQWEEG